MRIYRLQADNNAGYLRGDWGDPKAQKVLDQLKYDYSHELPDGTERLQNPDADLDTELFNAWHYTKQIYKGSPYIFGFAKIKDLYIWCCPARLGWLEANNIYIYVYDVPDEHVFRGTRQVAFNSNYVTCRVKISHKQLRHMAPLESKGRTR